MPNTTKYEPKPKAVKIDDRSLTPYKTKGAKKTVKKSRKK